MKRVAAALVFLAAQSVSAATTRYLIRPVYTSIRFSIVKWGVLKEEGIFRDFNGTLDYDPADPQHARIDVVVQTVSLDTKNETRDKVVRSDDFLDADRYPTLEFHSRSIDHDFVIGDLTIHGITKRVRFPVTSLGIRDLPDIGKLAGFETVFPINRRDYGVLGTRWGAIPGVLGEDVELHIIVGAIRPSH